MPELTEEQKQAALAPPPARAERPRAQRGVNTQRGVQTGGVTPGPMYSTVAPIAAPTGAPTAVQRNAARTAEQAFLPLVSKLAKFHEAVEDVVAAVDAALGVGVNRQGLQLELMQRAHKAGVDWGMVPESIRAMLEAAPAPVGTRRQAEEPGPAPQSTGNGGAADAGKVDSGNA